MVKQGIVTKIYHETERSHPMVVVKKKSGQIRICLDPRKLNEALVGRHFQTPAPAELLHEIPKAKYYTVLDGKSAYWHIPVAKECRDLLVMTTPFGKFRYNRLPFGLKISSQIFVEKMTNIFRDSFQNIKYVDDLLIYADTIQEHNKKLKGILEKAKEKNIKFDLTKAQICLTKVRFLGHLISQNGIDPEPNKIDKLITFKRPEDKKSLQRIMGLYNYLGKFIPNLAASTSNIRGILRKNVVWYWGPKQDGEFDHIKECVRNAPSLAHFDKSKMLILQCDASKDAMGAALLQEDRPLAFASASFSDSQKQYSQIEKELLSVYYGCKKFEYLLSGHTFVVQTDHQPLLPLVKKPLSDISPRLQRLVMKLIAFDFKLQYKPGKYLIVADTLSRDTHPMDELPTPFLEDKRMVKMLCLSRSLRCQIPRITPLYRPYQTNWRSIENAKRKRQSSMKEQYDRNSKSYPKVNEGEDAWCQIHPRETWTPVKISAQADSPQSFEVVTPSGNRLIRNQQFIRPRDGGYEKSQLSSEPITASPEAQHPQCYSPTMGESSTAPIQRSSEETNMDQREGATTSAGIAPEPSGRPRFSRSTFSLNLLRMTPEKSPDGLERAIFLASLSQTSPTLKYFGPSNAVDSRNLQALIDLEQSAFN
ncbi:K02A2.6-like [Cordylochernes scorpioides]|uniref:K02A2.6-like n=1 Tax=Cordylochernes scorpioides TaxID=51811 RepID=A0ABY6LDJ4_9ARAC|nr:K02A2.6-like [Cordylochernes scorpioides]